MKRLIALAALVAVAAFAFFDWSRFVSDFWPPDRSYVAPNLVAAIFQGAAVLIVVALIADSIKTHVTAQHADVHKKLNHIIEHSTDIPPFEDRPNSHH